MNVGKIKIRKWKSLHMNNFNNKSYTDSKLNVYYYLVHFYVIRKVFFFFKDIIKIYSRVKENETITKVTRN